MRLEERRRGGGWGDSTPTSRANVTSGDGSHSWITTEHRAALDQHVVSLREARWAVREAAGRGRRALFERRCLDTATTNQTPLHVGLRIKGA